jgi:hypothetical protein
MNADYLYDEENALLENKEEQDISSIIENDLKKVRYDTFHSNYKTSSIIIIIIITINNN